MRKPKLLDLFCCQGGAAEGYYKAGFDGFNIVGVDNKPQPKYPFEFVQADAIEYLLEHGHEFDAIHASPPCQVHCALKSMPNFRHAEHEDLIPQTREALLRVGKPYVMENVPGAPLQTPIILCGSMFGLQTTCGAKLRRHRKFEANWPLVCDLVCDHTNQYAGGVISVVGQGAPRGSRRVSITITITGHSCQNNIKNKTITVTGSTAQQHIERNPRRVTFSVADARIARGIDWMGIDGLSQAVPPAYTEYIGSQLIAYLAIVD